MVTCSLQAEEKPSAYIWQRAWTPEVCESVRQHSGDFSKLVALKAEIAFKENSFFIVRVPIQYSCLPTNGCAVGLALRINFFNGLFSATNEQTKFILGEISTLLADAKTNHLKVAELQIDFDCAESKLDGYRVWVKAIRERFPNVPLVITALPTWLKQPDFKELAQTAGEYVLQVHSLDGPKSFDNPVTLCDPAKARAAVEKASAIGVPFQVALPTYGYTIAFDAQGKFIRLSAEGATGLLPVNGRTRQVGANAREIAELVQNWQAHPPTNFQGVIWYRLPLRSDRLNWNGKRSTSS